MKIMVFHRRTVLAGVIILVLVLTMLCVGKNTAQTVAKMDRDLPIYCVDTGDEKKVAISFDAAWGNEDTEQLIEILKKYDVKATFFVVGEWVEKYPESVKALSDAGHEVMNHSNTHPHMTQISKEKMKEEVTECNNKIEKITGKRPNLFRAPYGDYNNDVVQTMRECGCYTIQWDVEVDATDGIPHGIRG